MKKKIILFVAILGIIFGSCELEDKVFDKYAPQTVYTDVNGMRAGVIGGYAFLRHFNMYKNWAWNLPVLGHDLVFPFQGPVFFPSTDKSQLTSGYNAVQNPWDITYQMIGQASLLLHHFPGVNVDSLKKEEYLGHAFFLRAFGLFDMYRRHGGVIVPTTATIDASNLYLPVSTAEETLAQIISDFDEASKRLPALSEQSQEDFGLATKGSADGFLGLAYLYNGEYQKAIDKFDEVINSNEYELVDWDVLWSLDTWKQAYNEVLFGVQFINDPNVTGVPSLGNDLPSRFIWGNDARGIRGVSTFRVQRWFYMYATTGVYQNDYRSEMGLETEIPNKNNANNSLKTWPRPDAWDQGRGSSGTGGYPWLSGKFVPGSSQTTDLRTHDNDYYFLRLSEIYLLKAEAINELNGPTQAALDAFNEVRERARRADGTVRANPVNLVLADVPDKDAFRLALVQEKAVEFVGEGVRFFDLRRIKRSDGKTMLQYMLETWHPNYEYGINSTAYDGVVDIAKSAFVFNERDLWMPIPATEILSNTAVTEGDQRPGW